MIRFAILVAAFDMAQTGYAYLVHFGHEMNPMLSAGLQHIGVAAVVVWFPVEVIGLCFLIKTVSLYPSFLFWFQEKLQLLLNLEKKGV